jgi:metal-responsive CopG/Arc/MetJ family transcriptional regulator
MAIVNKPPKTQFSVYFPSNLVEEIDTICNATFTTRTSWILKAAQEKLDRERAEREKKIIEKFKEE